MLKYLLLNHLHKHHGTESSSFTHQELEIKELLERHPEFSQKVENLFEKLRRDLQNLADELDEEN